MMSDYQKQLEELIAFLEAVAFKEYQLATFRAKIAAELDTSSMGGDLLLGSLEVLIEESFIF